eukprot:4455497-Alexandrium_andersonii.AAC.1
MQRCLDSRRTVAASRTRSQTVPSVSRQSPERSRAHPELEIRATPEAWASSSVFCQSTQVP